MLDFDIECPYCGIGLNINHDDGRGYEENVKHDQQCSGCEKIFIFETSRIFYYEPEKADCLNDSEHLYKPTKTFPVRFTRMKCSMCDEERDPTDEEMKEILKLES